MAMKMLNDVVKPGFHKVVNPEALSAFEEMMPENSLLVVLVAGKGTRFGKEPKCIQMVQGTPLARHSIDAFRRFSPSPVICIVGYRYIDVVEALGNDNVYVLSDNPAGGTGYAVFEYFSVPDLVTKNPLLIITMGDRVIPSSVFRKIEKAHTEGDREADLTFMSAVYEPPKNSGKGRVIRDESGNVLRIMEERDIMREENQYTRQALLGITEGNCPLYIIRASTLFDHLSGISNNTAQGQYYLTDIVQSIAERGGEIRTITTRLSDPEYDLLTSDVTQPIDLAMLEGLLSSNLGLLVPEEMEIERAAGDIIADKPAGQVRSITRQIGDLLTMIKREKLPFEPDKPVGIGISGGRLRIAFMHPDMVRFYGPAWQMPIGASSANGDEQIVVIVQTADDGRIHYVPFNQQYRESIDSIPSDFNTMYPDDEVSDINTYEKFGTRMSEELLLSLGYFSDEELAERRRRNLPLPPSSLWISSNMRRPFALIGNAIASLRTLKTGSLGVKIRETLGQRNFKGLHIVSAGNIPQGGFSSSSAVTVAVKNAINSLYEVGITPDLLVHLACQAEYGTGVRAGSLDQATEQKGSAGKGTLISSNPKDNYRILGTFPVPDTRYQIIFPYSVERDRNAWKWSWGAYAEKSGDGCLTTTEMRKLTGKAAEIAALLVRLPLETDFFKHIEDDLLADGELNDENTSWICSLLLRLPLLITKEELACRLAQNHAWLTAQIMEVYRLEQKNASFKADEIIRSMLDGWNDPVLRRTDARGVIVKEKGVPLRAIVAYLFAEVAKNFYLIYHPESWIECVTHSQRGDCSVSIDFKKLPGKTEMENRLGWENGAVGPDLLNVWLEKFDAKPFDFNAGLDDMSLAGPEKPVFRKLSGSSFFRGLALIDLAEAMLKKAFGDDSVAVRINAAGQGDYFQVHIDMQKIDPDRVKQFIRKAIYRRFGLKPNPDFVEVSSGGGASGIRLSRFDFLSQLMMKLNSLVPTGV